MNAKFYTYIRAMVLAIMLAVVVAGCEIPQGNQHSAYRSIHGDAQAGNVAQVATDLSQNPNEINQPDDTGRTPLHLAASYDHTDVVKLLLDKGANINSKANDGSTPLHVAAQEGCANTVTLLLTKGADVNARDNQGHTPLGRAKQWHQDVVVQILSQHGGTE